MDIGQQVDLEIASLVYRGNGLARKDGLVVFVPHVAAGERVTAEILRVRKNYAEARLVTVEAPSPDRIAPCCTLADGTSVPGCVYDHLAYPAEVSVKNGQLLDMLRRLPGCAEVQADPPFASPLPLHYRNKIVLHARRPRGTPAEAVGEPPILGYLAEDNRTVIDLPQCPLARAPINEALARFRDGESFRQLAHGDDVTFRWTSADGVKSWVGRPPKELMLSETSPAGPLTVPADGFYQVNPEVGYALVRQIAEWYGAERPGVCDVLDLYCGVGVFGLACAAVGTRNLLGVESGRGAVAAAQANAAALNLTGAFHCVSVAQAASQRFGGIDCAQAVVIADPPRDGFEPKVAAALVRASPARIFYVSCDPATLCRDLKTLLAGGYRISGVRMFDMFPRTAHFESVVALTRAQA
jgi:tRNA/tmRNA/rRNA uracil-C5-methylase (TrmA/RlmC/RlmD family)